MTTLALVVLGAAVALGISRFLKVPAAGPAILAGFALKHLHAPLEANLVRSGLLLSATFLIFAMGAQIDRRDLTAYRRAAFAATALYLLVTAAIAAVVGAWLGFDVRGVGYLGLALASSSTLVAVELLSRRERLFEPVGRYVLAVVITQDVAVILVLVLLVLMPAAPEELLRGAVALMGMGAAFFGARTWLLPRLFVRASFSEEERLLLVVSTLFVFMGAAWWGGLPVVLGAYLAGALLSRFPVGGIVRAQIAAFSDFFIILFFVLLGAVLQVPRPTALIAEILLAVSVFLLRPMLLLPLAIRAGMSIRAAIEAIALLGQAGELGLIVALVGLQEGQVGEKVVSIVAFVAVITSTLTPWLSRHKTVWWLTHRYPGRSRAVPTRQHAGARVVLIGCGEGGQALLEGLRTEGVPVVVVDEDPAVVAALERQGVLALRGDAAHEEVLGAAGTREATAIVSTMRRIEDNLELLRRHPGKPVLVRVFSAEEAEQVRARGGLPVVESELASEAAVRWYRKRQEAQAAEGAGKAGAA